MRTVSLDELTIDDERSVRGVALYDRLKQALRRSDHRFQIPAAGTRVSWDRALFLNLTYWNGAHAADVLCDDHIPADVVAHVAWHQVVSRQLARGAPGSSGAAPAAPTAEALFFAESIASAFDLYLVGRLLLIEPDSDFITTQVPLMAECAQEAGLPEAAFATLMQEVAGDPERAFEDLRALLLDAVNTLFACAGAAKAQAALERLGGHRFAPLLHHYQLSNWILYGRAYAAAASGAASGVGDLDATLRQVPVSLDWLAEHWIDADLPAPPILTAHVDVR
jgi:hypothetical protein